MAFLSSEQASYITGQSISVDGGAQRGFWVGSRYDTYGIAGPLAVLLRSRMLPDEPSDKE
jgi:hypothetical protein